MAQITLNSSGVASSGALVLQSNGTTTAVTISTAQVATLEKDAVVQGVTVGRGAGAVATNTAVGASALAANTTGDTNTATGYQALTTNTSGTSNTAYGVQALRFNTTGGSNASFGRGSLNGNTTGSNNTALGESALTSSTTASNNTAVGYQAGYGNTTGLGNTIMGYQAGYTVGAGNNYNTFIGYQAGYAAARTSGNAVNTAIGYAAGSGLTNGFYNTFIGPSSGSAVTTGAKNTIIGGFSGNSGGLNITTSDNYIVLSDGDGNPRSWFNSGAGTNWACAKDDADITMYYGPANLTPNSARSARLGFITNSTSKNWYMAHSWLTGGSLEFVQTTASGGSTMGGTAAFSLNSSGNGIFTGSLSKGSGSFRIDHPLPQLEETHHLVHSFIEGPQADLIYRGKVNLVSGRAEVNIDLASGMTEGTFVALCRDVQCFTTNESDWVHVRGSVSGNVLTIEAQDQTATSLISWMVIGERQDKHMIDTDWTDDNGKVIVEPIKPPKIERTERTEVQS